jgi:hypothetical protein
MIRRASVVLIALVLHSTPLFGQGAAAPVAQLTVKSASAEVHKSPSVASAVIGTARVGTVLDVRRNLGSWVEVPWPNAETGVAFLHVNTGTISRGSASAAPNEAQAAIAQIREVEAACMAASDSGTRAQPAASRTTAADRAAYVSLPPRRVGVGASLNSSAARFGVTARTWLNNRLGVQFYASRPQIESADGQSIPATQLAPSVLYSLPEGVTNSVWLRPYVGSGPRLYRANLETGVGYEAFGGVEATLASMPQFGISADVGYRWSRPNLSGFQPQEIGFSLSGHWYVK